MIRIINFGYSVSSVMGSMVQRKWILDALNCVFCEGCGYFFLFLFEGEKKRHRRKAAGYWSPSIPLLLR